MEWNWIVTEGIAVTNDISEHAELFQFNWKHIQRNVKTSFLLNETDFSPGTFAGKCRWKKTLFSTWFVMFILLYFDIWRLIRHKIKLFQKYIEDWRSNQSKCYIWSPTSPSTKIISSKNLWGMCIYSTLCFNTREPKTNGTIVLSTLLLLLNLN